SGIYEDSELTFAESLRENLVSPYYNVDGFDEVRALWPVSLNYISRRRYSATYALNDFVDKADNIVKSYQSEN
ncbi:MAG: hypothetical protein IJC83_05580, partial [Oscillospiraceae bacterium]|nr:hypothetical protein [Oscillospiraceae bacterium]